MRVISIFLGLWIGIVLSALPLITHAHEIKPGYLEITELSRSNITSNITADKTTTKNAQTAFIYDVIWKAPIQSEQALAITPQFQNECRILSTGQSEATPNVFITRSNIDCETPLEGSKLSFKGLDATLTDILVRFEPIDGQQQTLRATAKNPIVTIALEPSQWDVAKTYFILGVEHIWFGFDHLLFVLGLVLLIKGKMRIVKTITAFTIAHSMTLIATTLGWVSLSIEPVEAVIALSILFLAVEIAKKKPGQESFTERKPWVVASAFGLLHGFGFASALSNIGMPYKDVPTALLTFNIGVEFGQLVFVAIILGAIFIGERLKIRRLGEITASYLIGSLSVFWLIQRVI